ncbi:autophagy- protein 2 [Monosporozyma unispora]|nr:autophagy- protein 2 [Kazachstania unispora]
MGFWLPQNLQKRLLLRVLQQISIFSNLDLSNLDISLGSNSKFSFNDIHLHVSELNVPYFDIKSGLLDQLELLLNVSGGLDVNGKGIHFIVRIKPQEPSEEEVLFSLTKSIQNLTTSIIEFSDNDADIDAASKPHSDNDNANTNQSIPGAFLESIPEQTQMDQQKLSKLQSMRNKALNLILNKLTILLQDITIELEDSNGKCQYEIRLERLSLLSREDNIRQISIKGLSINHYEERTWYQNEDNEESNLYNSKFTNNSMYMSALGSLNEAESKDANKVALITIDFIQVCFQGLSSVDDMHITNITVDINNIDISPSNIIKLNDDVFMCMVRSMKKFLKNDLDSTEDETEEMNNEITSHNISGPNSSSLLSFFCVKTIRFQLAEDNVIIFEQLYLNQADNGEMILNIDNLKSNGSDFQVKIEKKPIVKGIIIKESTTLTLSSHIDMKVNKKSLLFVDSFYKGLNKFLDILFAGSSVPQMHYSKKEINNNSPSQSTILIKGKGMSLSIEENGHIFSLVLDPFTFSREQNLFRTNKLFGILNDGRSTQELFSINNISLKLYEQKQKIATFNEMLQTVYCFTNFMINIESILIYISVEQFEIIINKFIPIFTMFNEKEKSEEYNRKINNMRKSVKILTSSSIKRKESLMANQIIYVKTIKFRIKNILEETSLGLIKGKLLQNMFVFPCIGDEIICTAETIDLKRIPHESTYTESVINSISYSKRKMPNLYINFVSQDVGPKYKIKLSNVEMRYKVTWLNILQELDSHVDVEPVEDNSTSHDKKSIFDISMIDSALLLQPYRLNTCLLVTFDYLNNNIESLDTFTVNSVFKNGNISLNDEFKGIHKESSSKAKDITQFYATNGFSIIGRTKNMRIQTTNKNNKIDMIFNIDQLSLLLCADSFNSFIQTGIDLKYPETFADEKKYKNALSESINVMENIDLNFFNKIHVQNDITTTNSSSKNLNIIERFIDKESLQQDFVSTNISHDSGISTSNNISDSLPEIKINANYLDKQKVYEGPGLGMSKETAKKDNASLSIDILIKRGVIKLFDGYDWIYSRKMINKEISKLDNVIVNNKDNQTLEEPFENETKLFNSIYVSTKPDVNIKLAITKTIQNPSENEIILPQQLNLHPSKSPKLMINFEKFSIRANHFNVAKFSELQSKKTSDVLNSVNISVDTFDIVDNLVTSTWNKFASLLRHEHWTVNDPMFSFHLDMIKPLDYLEAIEYIMKVSIAPLRLHIDQDMLDFLIRFMGFQDSRFDLIDDYPDIFFLQKFEMDPLKLVIDYKPKKIDYIALKSGHINELMNFFTINGSIITLKGIKLFGINGFDSLGDKLREIWKPDIIKRQMGGVLGGLTPLKTFISLGSGVKTLVTVLMSQYKQDSMSLDTIEYKPVKTNVFLKTSTGKFIKLSANMITGAQTLLETTEEMLGGPGSKARETTIEEDNRNKDLLHVNQLLIEDQLIGAQTVQIKGKDPTALIIDTTTTNIEGGMVKPKIVSLYADQPLNIHQGLEEAYHSLEKHMQIVYDTVWKNDEEEDVEDEEPRAAAVSVAKIAPIAIIRPLIGATEALSKALQGIANQIDKDNIADLKDKYKSLKY